MLNQSFAQVKAASEERARVRSQIDDYLPGPATDAELEAFRSQLEARIRGKFTTGGFSYMPADGVVVTLEKGSKYCRVVRKEGVSSASSHCFIDLSNGNILKAAGWKAPEKRNPRGNIRGDWWMKAVTEYGAVYLR